MHRWWPNLMRHCTITRRLWRAILGVTWIRHVGGQTDVGRGDPRVKVGNIDCGKAGRSRTALPGRGVRRECGQWRRGVVQPRHRRRVRHRAWPTEPLLALSIVIAIFGIVNTLALNVSERTKEIGLLRAIGTSNGQVLPLLARHGVQHRLLERAARRRDARHEADEDRDDEEQHELVPRNRQRRHALRLVSCSDDDTSRHTHEYVQAEPGANVEQLGKDLKKTVKPFYTVSVLTRDEFKSSMSSMINSMLAIIYALLALSIVSTRGMTSRA